MAVLLRLICKIQLLMKTKHKYTLMVFIKKKVTYSVSGTTITFATAPILVATAWRLFLFQALTQGPPFYIKIILRVMEATTAFTLGQADR
jgi:hypothetical protein